MKTKYVIVIIVCAVAITLALSVVGITAYRESPVRLLSMGEKYLLDLEYEKAIVAFEKLIVVEPRNARGYEGLAQAHSALGDYEKAIEVLMQGYEATGEIALYDAAERMQAEALTAVATPAPTAIPASIPAPTPAVTETAMLPVTLEGDELARLKDFLETMSYVLSPRFPDELSGGEAVMDFNAFFGTKQHDALLYFISRMRYTNYLPSNWQDIEYFEYDHEEVDMRDVDTLVQSAFGFTPQFDSITRAAPDESMQYQVIDNMLYIEGDIQDTSENTLYITSAQTLGDQLILDAYFLNIAYAGSEGHGPDYEGTYRFWLKKNDGLFGYQLTGISYVGPPEFTHITTYFALSDSPESNKKLIPYDYDDDSYYGWKAEKYHGYYQEQDSPGNDVGDWLLFESDMPQTLNGFTLESFYSESASTVSAVTLEFSDGSVMEVTPYTYEWWDDSYDWDWNEYGSGFGIRFDHPITTTSVKVTVTEIANADFPMRKPIGLIQFF